MRTWLTHLWEKYRGGFWFIPSLMTFAAMVLGLLLPEVDRQFASVTPVWMQSSAETARAMLTTLAGAMITAAGVVFSVTIVALSITSSQFGPRLLRNFLNDSVTQLALGSCLASSLYSLLLLGAFSHAGENIFLPHISIFLALFFALVTLYILIYCIHRVASAMQADIVVAEVTEDLDDAIDRLFPEKLGEASDIPPQSSQQADKRFSERTGQNAPVVANKDGYLQAIDYDGIITLAVEHDSVIKLSARPGDFIMQGMLIAELPSEVEVDKELQEKLNKTFLVGNRRTTQQDVECAVNELVEVAVRALSPGINDPFTACRCVDRLGAAMRRLAQREMPIPFRLDKEDQLRVVARGYTFPRVLNCAFDQIRQHSRGNVAVSMRLLEAMEAIARVAKGENQKAATQRQAEMVFRGCLETVAEENDRSDLSDRYRSVLEQLGVTPEEHEPFNQEWHALSGKE